MSASHSSYSDDSFANGTAANGKGNGNAAGHAENAKNNLLSCKVRNEASGACRDAATQPANSERHSPYLHHARHSTRHSLTPTPAAQSAMAAVNNHPTTQNLKDNIANGEVSVAQPCPRLDEANSGLATQCPTAQNCPCPSAARRRLPEAVYLHTSGFDCDDNAA